MGLRHTNFGDRMDSRWKKPNCSAAYNFVTIALKIELLFIALHDCRCEGFPHDRIGFRMQPLPCSAASDSPCLINNGLARQLRIRFWLLKADRQISWSPKCRLLRRPIMFKRFVCITSAALLLAIVCGCNKNAVVKSSPAAEESRKAEQLRTRLIGTWVQISMKVDGRDRSTPQDLATYKHITPAGFIWLSHDRITGRISRAAGGTYTLRGNVYTEKIEYGIGNQYEVIRNSQPSFTATVDGDKWYHKGSLADGQTIDEIWERVKP
jgi:hypothetical protein